MHAGALDWAIIAAFFGLVALISFYTKRLNRSVAGFLSAERCAGRYLLTISTAMAFCSAIGTDGSFEQYYRQGFAIGGVKDCIRLIRDLKTKEVNAHDDGSVHDDHSTVDEDLGVV